MIKKRGLGKSLDALLAGSITIQDNSSLLATDTLSKLPLDVIQRGHYQPRQTMTEESLESLTESIRQQGVIQPIIVRPIENNRYEIIAGERRWRAAERAGLTDIPVIIRPLSDTATVAVALIENIQRENLNPIEEAVALKRLLDEFSMTHQAVADAISKSRAYVSNLLRLLSLPDAIKQLLISGQLEMGHARALLTLSSSLQQEAAHKIIENHLSVRETEAYVNKLQTLSQSNPKPISHRSLETQQLEENLYQRLRMPVQIKHNAKGRGKLVVKYKNLSELTKLLEYFEQNSIENA